MRDPARELADRLHLLTLAQLRFGLPEPLLLPPALSHIQREVVGTEQLAAISPQRAEFDLVPARPALGVTEFAGDGEGLARQRPRKVSPRDIALLGEVGKHVEQVVAGGRAKAVRAL